MKWIHVKDKLPAHMQIVFIRLENGSYAVALFLNTPLAVKFLNENNIFPKDNIEENDYYFCSLENQGSAFGPVSHWCKIKPPLIEKNS
jgi:hypothetical protein